MDVGMTNNNFREPIVLVVEFRGDYDQRAGSNTERLFSVSVTVEGSYRVKIEAPSPVSANLGFVTLSDEVLPAEAYNALIRPMVSRLANAVVRLGSL